MPLARLAPLEHQRRAPQQHEAVERRRSREEDPLAEVGEGRTLTIAGGGIGARGEEERGAGSEAESRRYEIERIDGGIVLDQAAEEILEGSG